MASKQDGAGFRTPEDVARRYMGNIKLTQEEIEQIKQAIVCDTVLSITSTAPVQNKTITAGINSKVSKETGKGLSSNDFTNSEKTKLDGMPTITQADVDRWNASSGSGWTPPIGYIWISTDSTNPQSYFTGTVWEAIGGKFLLGADSTYTAGSTGGEATHTLTTNEMPSHTHNFKNTQYDPVSVLEPGGTNNWYGIPMGQNSANQFGLTNVGGSQPHNNMPPYISVYMFKRKS